MSNTKTNSNRAKTPLSTKNGGGTSVPQNTNQVATKAPFGWIGGKSRLAKQIIALMPPHALYVEVFGGALSVFYAKQKQTNARYREVVNDINNELINLHRQIQTRPQTLSLYLNQMLISRTTFEQIKKGVYKPKNDIQRAAHYYYLLTQSFGSKAEHFAMSAKTRKPKNIYKNFQSYTKRLKLVTIENLPFDELISRYDKQETLFYLDPPYVGTENYYQNTTGFTNKEHLQLATQLKSIKGKFILSYNDTEYIRALYPRFKIKELTTTYTLNNKSKPTPSNELLITNF